MRTPAILITTIVVISAINNPAEGEDGRYTTMTIQNLHTYVCSECTVHTVLSIVYKAIYIQTYNMLCIHTYVDGKFIVSTLRTYIV